VLVLAGVAVLANLNLHDLKLDEANGRPYRLVVVHRADLVVGTSSIRGESSRAFFHRHVPGHGGVQPAVVGNATQRSGLPASLRLAGGLRFMAALVVVCTLAGYLIMNRWQRRVTATELD